MTTLEEARAAWERDPDKAQWALILQSPAWKKVSELCRLEFVEAAVPQIAVEHDSVVARRLIRQNGALTMLTKLQAASSPAPALPPPPTDPWDHITLSTEYQQQ